MYMTCLHIVHVTQMISILLQHFHRQPRTQDLSLGKTLAAAGHVPRPIFSTRGCVGKVSNYINMLPVGILCLTVKNINFANY